MSKRQNFLSPLARREAVCKLVAVKLSLLGYSDGVIAPAQFRALDRLDEGASAFRAVMAALGYAKGAAS